MPHPSSSLRSALRSTLVAGALVLAGVTAGCSSEEAPYDDGSQGVPLAGLGAELDAAGVEVLSPDLPVDASTDDVEMVLADADVEAPSDDAEDTDDLAAFDPTGTAGLLGLVADGSDSTLVLVFTTSDAAAVFAAADPDVFADTAVEEQNREAFLSGNLVGYSVTDGGHSGRLRAALDALIDASS